MVTSLFLGFSEECCNGNVSRKGCLLSSGRGTRTMYQRMSDTGSEWGPRLGQDRKGQREEGRSIQHDSHKPSHLSLRNNFSKCFSNGMVYNNAKLWTRHANQHQKLVFPNKGCQGHIPLLNTVREKIPFQIPPLVSICPHLI